MNKNNPSIQCVVSECRYHADSADYCTLDQILVGKDEQFTMKAEGTDCKSFIAKNESSFT